MISTKRLLKEASDMIADPIDGILAGPKGGEDLFKWEGIVRCV
jgi:ubiquitin-protein ligase